jgi:spermidine/putrescine transport system substrate-binding protein
VSDSDRTPGSARTVSRRAMLQAMGLLGIAGTGAVVAACSGTPAASSAAATAASTPAGTPPPTPTLEPGQTPAPTPEPTPQPTPEAELNVYNWDEYIGEDTISSFEEKTGIKVNYDIFDSYETMTTKISTGNSGYDVTFATGVDVPGLLARGLVQPLDLSLIPNLVNLGTEWQNPGYDPGNQHSVPYMWWTTGFGYNTDKIKGDLTSWADLWDPKYANHMAMLDDYREVFAAALIRLGYSVNTTSDAELDEALALLEEQKPLLRKYTADDIGDLKSANVWLSHAWSGDVAQVTSRKHPVKYVIPTEGGVRGSDAMVLLANAPHPIAAHLFINHMLDAEVAAANTNYIYYMGPNEAAKAYIDPDILDDPTLNPDKALVAKLQELLDLGPDLQKYQERWTKLRS